MAEEGGRQGEEVYQKWGRAAVFVTPSMVSGALKMRFRQFAVWNFLAGLAFVLSVGPGAYGVGRVSAGHHDPVSLGMLIEESRSPSRASFSSGATTVGAKDAGRQGIMTRP